MKLYHLRIPKGSLPSRVILVGSRRRVSLISEIIGGRLIDEGRQLIAVGSYDGKEVAVVDTGMGPSSASIVVREVIEAMDRRGILVRAGTCGSLQPHVEVGHLVVSKAVISDDQVSRRIIGDYPLISDEDVVRALETAAKELGYERGKDLHVGVTHTKDALYEFEDPELSADPESGRKGLDFLSKMGVLATEMEMSVILALTHWYNVRGGALRSGGVFLVVSPLVSRGLTFIHPDQTDLVRVALRTVTSV